MTRLSKRIGALILALVLALSCLCVSAAAADSYTNGDQSLTLNEDGTFQLTDGGQPLYSGTYTQDGSTVSFDTGTAEKIKASAWYYKGTVSLNNYHKTFSFDMNLNDAEVEYSAVSTPDSGSVTGYLTTITVEDASHAYENVYAYGAWMACSTDHTPGENGVPVYDETLYAPADWKNGMYYNGESAIAMEYADGAWTLTLPLASSVMGIQCYRDIADANDLSGVRLADDKVVEIPYDAVKQSKSFDWSVSFENKAAAGKVDYTKVCTAADGTSIKLSIYTPYGYDAKDANTLYPVLYLIPGSGTNYQTWFVGGRTHMIFDNLTAAGKVAPTVVVTLDRMDALSYLVSDVIGYIEANYNVYKDAAHRAVAGSSMGGVATSDLWLDPQSNALFSSFGLFSGADKEYFENDAYEMPADEKAMLNAPAVLIGGGTTDFNMFQNNDRNSTSIYRLNNWLNARNVEHGYMVVGGGHTWTTWTQLIETFATEYLWTDSATDTASDTSADAALRVVSNTLYGEADTEGFSTLKAYVDAEQTVPGDPVTYTGSVVLSAGDGTLDISGASAKLTAGDGYYVDDLIFTGGSLSVEGGKMVFTMDKGDLTWNNYGYPVAEGGMEWSAQGGDGGGRYYFNMVLSGVKQDGKVLDDVTFRIKVYIYGREFSATSSPQNPGQSVWGAGGYDQLALPYAEKADMKASVTAADAPVWTWEYVGDGRLYGGMGNFSGDYVIDFPVLCDLSTDNFYITWPEGVDASALTDGDVTITLRSQYGDEKVLVPNTGTKTIAKNGKEVPDGEYSVFADKGVTQVSVNLVVFSFIPVYNTMTIEVNTGKVTGYDSAVSKTYDVGSVYTHMVQTGGGLDLANTTVTVQNLFGIQDITKLKNSDIFNPSAYYYVYSESNGNGGGPGGPGGGQGGGPGGPGGGGTEKYFLIDNGNGTYTVTENKDEATVYANDAARYELIGHSVFHTDVTAESIRAEYQGKTYTFTRKSSGGNLLDPQNLQAEPGYVLTVAGNYMDRQRWAWLYLFNNTENQGWLNTDKGLPFHDANDGSYYYDAVEWAYNKKIANGTGSGNFSPDDILTRAQAVALLWRAAGSPDPTGAANPFTDVTGGVYYAKAAQWAAEQGVVNGTILRPNEKLTFGQAIVFLWRAAGNTSFGSEDGDLTVAAAWALKNGIANVSANPKGDCSRVQMISYLYKYQAI